MSNKILIADDDKDIRELINIYLTNDGFETITVSDGQQAVQAVNDSFDFLILDIMMPNLNGLEACREIRKKYNMPILFLTAKNEDMDKVIGLSSGADDYLTKPFNPIELIARVKAGIRRYTILNKKQGISKDKNTIKIDDFTINLDTHEVDLAGEKIHLTKKEFDIFTLLGQNRGIVFSIDKIYNRVWGEENLLNSDNTVMVHIRGLRKKIEKDDKNPVYIKTIWGVGYKIEK